MAVAAEKALPESEERFRLLVESVKDYAIFMLDREGHVVTWNRGAEQITGYTPDEILEQHFSRFFTPEDLAADKPSRELAVAAEQGRCAEEGWRVRRDGSRFWASATITAMPGLAGEQRGFAIVMCDRTEHMQVEKALRESEAKFLAVPENAQAAFGILVGTRLVYANRYFAQLIGYSVEEILSMDFRQMTDPAFHELMIERAQRRLRGEPVPSHYEFLAITKSGEGRWIEFSPAVIEYKGQPAIIGTGFDVTERKRAEAALRESEAKFRTLADNARAAMGIIQGTRFVYANNCFAQLSGYTVEEILSMDFPQMVHPAFHDRMIDLARRRQLGEPVPGNYEFIAITKSGEERWVDFSPARIELNGQPAVIGIGFDITDRKRAEQELRRRTASLKLLSDTATRLLPSTRPSEELGSIFEALADQLGADLYINYMVTDDGRRLRLHAWRGLDEAAARQVEFVEFGQTFCATAAQDKRRIIVEDVQNCSDPKAALLRSLGLRTYVCYPLIDHGVLGTLSFGARHRDRFTEEELELIRAVCDQVVMALSRQRLTAELEHRAVELEQANRAKDQFMAVLSHELRTPLTPVLATASLLQDDPRLDEDIRQHLEIIRRNTEMEARLIDDLLDVTRIARGKIELDKRPVELCTIIRRAAEVCKSDLEARGLHFGTDMGPEAPHLIEADAGRLQQVFWNLLKNAIKFTPQGGCVGIRCRREDVEVRVQGSQQTQDARLNPEPRTLNPCVVVEVSDSGVGIDPEALPHIFKPFEQAGVNTTRLFGGLGLGLTISKALVEMHGGTIEAHSEGPGKGATLKVRLPLHVTAAETGEINPPAGGAPSPAARKLHILLVEDHGDSAWVLRRMLAIRGHEVQTAGDVAAGLQAAARESFDLLISDLGLPDRSGCDLVRELRARGQALPAIALSGYGQEQDVEQSLAAGFSAHLTKPTSLQQLHETIAAVVK